MTDARKRGSGSSSKPAKDALYEKIGKFLEAHPEAMDMNLDESDRLFEDWLKNGKA